MTLLPPPSYRLMLTKMRRFCLSYSVAVQSSEFYYETIQNNTLE